MSQTHFQIVLETGMRLTDEQRKEAVHMIAMKLKELEYNDEPRGNTIQRAFVMEEEKK